MRFQRAAQNASLRRGRPVSGGGPAPPLSSSPPPAPRPTSRSAAPAAASAHPRSAPSPHRPRRRTAPPNHNSSSSNSSCHSSCRQILTAGPLVLRELAAADFPIRGRHGGQVQLLLLPPAQLGPATLRQPPPAGPLGRFTSPSENRKQHPPLPILLRHGRRAMNRPGRQAGSPWRRVASHRRRR